MNFKVIDLLIGAFSGILIAFAVCRIVPAHWNMLAGMIAGGIVGMSLKFALLILLAPFFGAFEVMIPLSLIAMVVGMSGGMAAAHGSVAHGWIVGAGGVTGFIVAVVIYQSNKKLVTFK